MKIPARIIQTGKTRELSPKEKAVVTNLKLLHPEWEYVYFDDEDVRTFVREEFPQYRPVFEKFPYAIQRIDFFRYLAVFRLGGFYFDLDVLLSESLQPLLDQRCVFPFEELTLSRFLREQHGIDWEIGNYGFGASVGDPFLAAVIENCIRSQSDSRWVKPMMAHVPRVCREEFQVLNTTGPGLLTRTVAENPECASGMTILFPDDVCNPENWHTFGTYGLHLMDGSWRTKGSFLRRRLMWGWEAWCRRKIMPDSLRRGPTRELSVKDELSGAGSLGMARTV